MAEITIADGAVVTIDDQDAHILQKHTWRCEKDGYVRRKTTITQPVRKTGFVVMLHRVIMGAGKGQIVDHIDGNPLNNSRSNLRLCDVAGNTRNQKKQNRKCSSQYKGVVLQAGKWQAQIGYRGRQRFIGTFAIEEHAAHAYNKAAIALHGEFACLNPIGEQKPSHTMENGK